MPRHVVQERGGRILPRDYADSEADRQDQQAFIRWKPAPWTVRLFRIEGRTVRQLRAVPFSRSWSEPIRTGVAHGHGNPRQAIAKIDDHDGVVQILRFAYPDDTPDIAETSGASFAQAPDAVFSQKLALFILYEVVRHRSISA